MPEALTNTRLPGGAKREGIRTLDNAHTGNQPDAVRGSAT